MQLSCPLTLLYSFQLATTENSLCPFNFTETTHNSFQGTEFQRIGS